MLMIRATLTKPQKQKRPHTKPDTTKRTTVRHPRPMMYRTGAITWVRLVPGVWIPLSYSFALASTNECHRLPPTLHPSSSDAAAGAQRACSVVGTCLTSQLTSGDITKRSISETELDRGKVFGVKISTTEQMNQDAISRSTLFID